MGRALFWAMGDIHGHFSWENDDNLVPMDAKHGWEVFVTSAWLGRDQIVVMSGDRIN